MNLEEALRQITPPDELAGQAAKARWDSIAKPLGSLGLLEEAVIRVAALTGSARVELDKRCVTVFCADNGVVAEGVTQTGSEVTAVVAENFTRGETSVCAMARAARCDVIPVDIGVARDLSGPGLVVHKLGYGTGNIARGPAMTREQALDAITFGISLVGKLKREGCRIIATGEMGIGNTTTSSAVTAALLGLPAEEVTGRGAGLTSEGLAHKIKTVERALVVNHPDPDDGVDVLAKVGGFDLAGLAGVFLGGAVHRVPVLIDGFISAAALALGALGLRPLITAGMCLGEGTGAVAALPLLDMALAVYREMSTFREIDIDAYQPLS